MQAYKAHRFIHHNSTGLHAAPIFVELFAASLTDRRQREQFSALANREIEGMDNLIKSFAAIVEDFKRKPYGKRQLLAEIFLAINTAPRVFSVELIHTAECRFAGLHAKYFR